MKDEKPRCKCDLKCAHHRRNPSSRCNQPATNWDGDQLCEKCHVEYVKHLKDELTRVTKQIAKEERAFLLMQKAGTRGEKDLDKKTLDKLKTQHDKIARKLKEANGKG